MSPPHSLSSPRPRAALIIIIQLLDIVCTLWAHTGDVGRPCTDGGVGGAAEGGSRGGAAVGAGKPRQG